MLLEPIGELKVTIPDSYMGDVIGDLNKRRGRVMGMNPDGEGNQIVEAIRTHEKVSKAEAKDRAVEPVAQSGHPQPRGTHQRLPAPDVGRHAPARDDRHGAGLQPEAAHRRRADDGPRRDHPGANPRSAAPPARRHGHGRAG